VDQLGRFALLLALGLAAYGLVAAVVGARGRRPLAVESARTTAFALLAAVAAANGAMLVAILSNDFAIRYVAENSSRATPTFFKVLSLWSADDGSLLLWNLVLAGYLAAVAVRFRRYRPEILPWTLAVMYAVAVFYLLLVSGPSRPFATLAAVPGDGRGPQPLLQNHPLMAVHPPFLYLGFVGFTVPFAFAIAGLLGEGMPDRWVALTRRWTLVVWCFLTVGLLLGALWSYSVLGWGGYWAWDPVENAALLPWLMATAFLHSVMLQERRGMLKVWNPALAVGAFALTTFGTFLTRGSVLSSVHTFAVSAVGPLYLGFLALVLAGGFGLIAARAWRLRAPGQIDAVVSREATFVGNNLVLLTLTFVVLLGTVFPLAVEATSGRQVTVGGPYFRRTTVPLLLLLLFLAGVGPLLPWRGGPAGRLVRRLRVPLAAGAAVVCALALAGVRDPAAVLAFGLAAFVAVANAAEIGQGVRAALRDGAGVRAALRDGAGVRAALRDGAGVRAALRDGAGVRAWLRGRRRYGGLVVHIGLALAAVGVTASSTMARQVEVTLSRGAAMTFAGYELRYQGMRTLRQPQRVVLATDVAVTRDGRDLGRMVPSLNLYPAATEPIGTPSIRYGSLRDLYASVIGVDSGGEQATFRFFLNPGVTWLWVGGAVMAAGGLLAAWPARRRATARPRGPGKPERHELTGVGGR
jgi:cytochrome c-type biogenesis protein CcmF